VKKVAHAIYEVFIEALKSLGYYLERTAAANEHWKRGGFHLILRKRRRGRLSLDMHIDVYPHHIFGGHRSRYQGKDLDEEFQRIMGEYTRLRRKET